MKYGLIGTCYNMGISHIAQGFAQQLSMKTLLVDNKPFLKFPGRFSHSRVTKEITQADVDWLLEDIDVLFTIETPYYWGIYKEAKRRGIKTVLMPMIEWLDRRRPELRDIDLFVCPSQDTYDKVPTGAQKIRVPCEVPIDTSKFAKYAGRRIKKVRTFLHNSGHGGLYGRNSTSELLKAIKLVSNQDVHFIIRSQYPLADKPNDPRISYIEGNIENYQDLYIRGDCWIMPAKYGVAFVGLQESMAAGMLPAITDMPPFNTFIPPELRLIPKSVGTSSIHAGQLETYAEQSPELIAQSIDAIAAIPEKRVLELSVWARRTAQEWSWKTWKPKYEEIFKALCAGQPTKI